MTGGGKLQDGAAAVGESWIRRLLRPNSTSKFPSVTCSGAEGDLNDPMTRCAQSTYFPKGG